MARNVARLALRTRVRQLSDTENDANITDTEINNLLNLHMPHVYGILVAAGAPDYYSSSTTITTTSGTTSYALPADFRSLVNMYVVESADIRRIIGPMRESYRDQYKAPSASNWQVSMEYIPCCPVWTDDADNFDGVEGWDWLISALCARDILIKQRRDASTIVAMAIQHEQLIKSMSSNRDKGGARYVQDVEYGASWPRTVRLDAYRLRAGNVELYESLYGWP